MEREELIELSYLLTKYLKKEEKTGEATDEQLEMICTIRSNVNYEIKEREEN